MNSDELEVGTGFLIVLKLGMGPLRFTLEQEVFTSSVTRHPTPSVPRALIGRGRE